MQVADICSGAGGKSLILADIMKNNLLGSLNSQILTYHFLNYLIHY